MPVYRSTRHSLVNRSDYFKYLGLIKHTRGLIGFWPLDFGSGLTAFDESGFGSNGTLTNGPVWVRQPNGFLSLRFDGSNDFVNCGNKTILQVTSGGLTVSTWIRYISLTGNDGIASKDNGALSRSWILNMNNGLVRLITSTNGSTLVSGPTATISIGSRWWHVAGVWDSAAGELLIYLDGVSIGSPVAFAGPLFNSTQNLEIGRFNATTGRTPNMDLRLFSVYSRALSAGEINNQYVRGVPLNKF